MPKSGADQKPLGREDVVLEKKIFNTHSLSSLFRVYLPLFKQFTIPLP